MYLNRKNSGASLESDGTRLSLPASLEQTFTLTAPKQYEIEVLEIFTPDVLEHFVELNLKYDIELIDQKMLIFHPQNLKSMQDLEHFWEETYPMFQLLAPKLDRAQFEKIGTLPSHLS